MIVTKEMQFSRPIIDTAMYLSKVGPYPEVIEGIKLFLRGEVMGSMSPLMSHIKWEMSVNPPAEGEWLFIDGEYWFPTMQYSVKDHIDVPLIEKMCPACGNKFFLYQVYGCKKSNPNEWQSRLECSNKECMLEEYYKETKLEIINLYGKVIWQGHQAEQAE